MARHLELKDHSSVAALTSRRGQVTSSGDHDQRVNASSYVFGVSDTRCATGAGTRAAPVKMWSHFIGHGTSTLGWWPYFHDGYPGLNEALAILGSWGR